MHDAVAITLKLGAESRRVLGELAAPRFAAEGRVRSEIAFAHGQ
jgi:hypothetical protein